MRQLDLAGPEGNAFCLLGIAKTWALQLGLDYKAIQKDMQSSDYPHLVEVFEEHFGCVCELVNKPNEEYDISDEEYEEMYG